MIYEPLEDSFLMQETLKKYFKNKSGNIKVLDMGSGSGILAETCRELGVKNILTSDINEESIEHLKKLGFKAKKSDLFLNITK